MVKNNSERLPSVISTYEQYLQHINTIPLLTPEEEHDLALRSWENKDRESAHRLVISNLRFVIKIANEYRNYGLKLMDLIQEGNIGLMRAVRTFNPYKNVKLITYAVWWIRSYIHNYIQRNWSMVTLGTTQTQRRLFYKLKQEEEELLKQGFTPTTRLLSEKLGVSEGDITSMQQRLSGRDLSLNATLGGDYEGTQFIDKLISQSKPTDTRIAEEEEKRVFSDVLNRFKSTLKEKDLYILENRLLADNPLTLEEIGKRFNITKERIRQLENKIKKNLKKFLDKEHPGFKIS
ncbi:MAG: hypothetical protein A3F16_02190 [Deltaproteobacteria bacterium RIFCSPHIGHO2_12_FULL_43_9]|nr:MAG: hypothetical protein A3F16_02190 [Deltaproteobacteria bacterium RIFCSPHIGHO2_12_FULL_43_9]